MGKKVIDGACSTRERKGGSGISERSEGRLGFEGDGAEQMDGSRGTPSSNVWVRSEVKFK